MFRNTTASLGKLRCPRDRESDTCWLLAVTAQDRRIELHLLQSQVHEAAPFGR